MKIFTDALLSAAFALASLSAAHAVASDPGAFGICEHVTWSASAAGEYENRDTAFARCAAAGIEWLRCDVCWQYCATSSGIWSWGQIDNVFASAELRGIRLFPILRGTNPVTGGEAYNDLDAWGEFVRQFTTRYQGRLCAVEIWNEPDLSTFWTGTATQFATLVQRSYAAIKAIDPSITVVLGGVTAGGTDFLSSLYSNGVKNYCDAVAYHPYVWPHAPDEEWRTGNIFSGYTYHSFVRNINAVKSIMTSNGDGSKPLWLTQVGWPSGGNNGVSEAQQAAYLTNAVSIAFANGVEKFFAYELKAPETDASDPESFFGILHSDYSFKPAYLAYRDAIVKTESGAEDPYAAAVFLLSGDNWDVQSFATAGNWSDGAAPHSDADYLVANLGSAGLWFPLSGDATFGGRSLAVGRIGGLQGRVRNIGWGNTITIGSLALNNGRWTVAAGGDAATGVTLAGTAIVNAPASEPFIFTADAVDTDSPRLLTLASTLSGAAGTALRFEADGGSSLLLALSGDASAYAGGYILDGGAVTGRLSAAALAGPSGAGAISLRNGAVLAPFADGQVFATARALSAEDGSARIDVPAGQTFTLAAPISGVFCKTGSGTLVMDGGTIGTGRIVVAGGEVRVDIDTAQFISAIDGGRVVYCVPAGSLASAQSIATVSVPGPLAAGDVAVSEGAAALGWATSVRYEENAADPGTFTAYIDVVPAPRATLGTDSFEAYAPGTATAALPGWTGGGSVATATPAVGDPPGWPIPGETHERVLAVDGLATRSWGDSFARDSQSIDCLVQVRIPGSDNWRDWVFDDADAQLRLAFDTDGAPCLWHAGEDGEGVWTRLTALRAYADGDWVRVSADLDYPASGAAFAQVRFDGSCCIAPAGRRNPSDATPNGGSWFRLLAPAATRRKVSAIEFADATGVDDLVLASHAPALAPDFPTGSVTSSGGIPFAWFDGYGIPRDPAGDPDADGFTDLAEYGAGTDPLDPASHPPEATVFIVR